MPACAKWRREMMFTRACCTIGGDRYARVGFVPVRMAAPPSAAGRDRLVNMRPTTETIEVVLPDGSRLRVGNEVGLVALRRVLTALRG